MTRETRKLLQDAAGMKREREGEKGKKKGKMNPNRSEEGSQRNCLGKLN